MPITRGRWPWSLPASSTAGHHSAPDGLVNIQEICEVQISAFMLRVTQLADHRSPVTRAQKLVMIISGSLRGRPRQRSRVVQLDFYASLSKGNRLQPQRSTVSRIRLVSIGLDMLMSILTGAAWSSLRHFDGRRPDHSLILPTSDPRPAPLSAVRYSESILHQDFLIIFK